VELRGKAVLVPEFSFKPDSGFGPNSVRLVTHKQLNFNPLRGKFASFRKNRLRLYRQRRIGGFPLRIRSRGACPEVTALVQS
jgi:hypothetical protein